MAFIKVCGMTDARAVEAALAAGVDAIGFVFAPSVRRVTPEQAVELALPARGKVLCVAVTQHPDAALLQEIFDTFRPDVWQSDAADQRSVAVPQSVRAWPVLRERAVQGATAGAVASAAAPSELRLPLPGTRVLFEGPRSGTGRVADWSAARVLAAQYELILAGGLSPANVAEAIASVQPFGVDVSSGVEESPGRKSPALIESFVTTARAAFARLASGEK
jgi:phosphoribosylanthranilate isomerase